MRTRFTKMHGAGNDFVIIDARGAEPHLSPARIAALADRRRGIGFDQLVLLEPPRAQGDVFMRIHNADGSEAGACGNATRCVAALLGVTTIETVAGVLRAERRPDGSVAVNMGPPRLGWRAIPLAREADTLHLPLPGDPAACSMGNPHVTFFVPSAEEAEVAMLGPRFETDKLFPERANIGFAEVLTCSLIRLRVWERGAGLTLACGSGACAALVNAHRRGLASRRAAVLLDGGALDVEWTEAGDVLMAGPATLAFTGGVDLSTYPP
jgi:diaminopimelate epimerase